MKRCKNCLMPDTKPGLKLDKEGICPACRHAEIKKKTDYKKRFEELKKLCDKYRRNDGYYDCMLTVSGGKDSTFQVYIMKEVLGMNPLLVSVGDPYTKTKAGMHNVMNISKTFNCDIISFNLSPDLVKRMTIIDLKEFGIPTLSIDRAIYCFPIRLAINMNIPFIIHGENTSWEYGSSDEKETYSAINQIYNGVAKEGEWQKFYKDKVDEKEINMLKYPSKEKIEEAKLEPIYLSYFISWDGYKNYQIAKRYGFRDLSHEWKREGYIEDYDQIDSIGYLINVWMKYPKFGFARVTDVVGYWIRNGRMTKEEGIKLIREKDHLLDQKILDDFLKFTGLTDKEFSDIVEKFWNKELFEKIDGVWRLKPKYLPK